MISPDAINGSLEFGSALLMTLNVRRLTVDKSIAGISIIPTLFFDTWGFWNLYYYPALAQWWSFTGGACLVLVNMAWTGLAFQYGAWAQVREASAKIGGTIGKIKSAVIRLYAKAARGSGKKTP